MHRIKEMPPLPGAAGHHTKADYDAFFNGWKPDVEAREQFEAEVRPQAPCLRTYYPLFQCLFPCLSLSLSTSISLFISISLYITISVSTSLCPDVQQ